MTEVEQAVNDAIRLARIAGARDAEKAHWVRPSVRVIRDANEANKAAIEARQRAFKLLGACHVVPF